MSQQHVYDYYIDGAGCWFCEGNPVSDRELFRILSRSLFLREGSYWVRCEGEVHPVRVADAPLWIRYVHVDSRRDGSLQRVEIELEDGRREPLDPEALTVGRAGAALYTVVTSRRLPARFGKSAYYELAGYLTQDQESGPFHLEIAGQRYDLREVDPPA